MVSLCVSVSPCDTASELLGFACWQMVFHTGRRGRVFLPFDLQISLVRKKWKVFVTLQPPRLLFSNCVSGAVRLKRDKDADGDDGEDYNDDIGDDNYDEVDKDDDGDDCEDNKDDIGNDN